MAESDGPGKHGFFDWNYAMHVWTELRTREDLMREDAVVYPPFQSWKKQYDRNPQAALKALETHPQRDLIRKGHDLDLVFKKWDKMSLAWQAGLSVRGGAWNKSTGVKAATIESMNIFTGSCCDLPDWRTEKDKTKDDAEIVASKKWRWNDPDRRR